MATTTLIRYEAARHALAVCKNFDEVKDWIDKAAAMQAYSRMAQDKSLEVDAAEIRIRAERRLGEMLAAQKAGGGLNKGGRPSAETGRDERPVLPTLAEVGISKDLSARAQNLAAVPEQEFEQEVGEWRERVSAEGARVSAKLDARGAEERAKNPPQPAEAATPGTGTGPAVTAGGDDGDPSEDEAREAAETLQRARDKYALILLDEDDPLHALVKENAILTEKLTLLESRFVGLEREKAALQRQYNALRAKVK